MTGADIVTEARTWIGTRWMHQGRTRSGIDCAGLVLKVAHACDVFTFDTADYSRQATDESMLELCREHLEPAAMAEARPGDVAVMRFGSNRHIGIFGDYQYGGLTLIHAYTAARRVVEHRFTDDWLRSQSASLIAVFCFPGVTA